MCFLFVLIRALERKRSLHLTTHLQLTLRWQHITGRIEAVHTWFVKWCTCGPVHKWPPSCPPRTRIFSTDKNVAFFSWKQKFSQILCFTTDCFSWPVLWFNDPMIMEIIGLYPLNPTGIKQCASLLFIKVRGYCSSWSTFRGSASHARKNRV